LVVLGLLVDAVADKGRLVVDADSCRLEVVAFGAGGGAEKDVVAEGTWISAGSRLGMATTGM